MNGLVTEDDILRARHDSAFRRHLLSENLEKLLAALNLMRKNNVTDPASARQVREGIDLAVKLADRLQRQPR